VELDELEVEEGALSALLEELSVFLGSLLDSDLDSDAFEALVLLDSPFWPLRA
jgi:hypothetical protein